MRGTLVIPCILATWLACALLRAGTADKHPHIGYVYPAGVQRGTTAEVKIGGEDIYGSTAALVSGKGVTVLVTDAKEPVIAGEKNKKTKKKNQTVIDEIVTLRITVARDAELVPREICLVTPDGITNKLAFQIGQLKEVREVEPNNKREVAMQLPQLPVLVNGQTLPGDVDMFKFSARKGQHLVVEASARALIPYIADAVPGWFQAILSLYDAQGKEVAVADDFRFNPDPVLFYDVPATGEYALAVRDSIYRGREDFVYRVQIGELPFITSVFPLGAPHGDKPAGVKFLGKNISGDLATVAVDQAAPAVRYVSVNAGGLTSNRIPFAIGDLPEILETEAAAREGQAQEVAWPVIINGCVRAPGEKDSYSFDGKKGQAVCLEVRARRLGSPLDSCVVLLNSRGEKLGENDDIKDKGEGLLTHVADSELVCALPEDGIYTARIFDTQGKGGGEYGYRLRISPPAPDFELRMTPSAVSVPKGGSAQLTVHAIRKDGFTGEITLALDESSSGLVLDGALIPEGTDRVRVTVTAPEKAAPAAVVPTVRGTATVAGKTVSRVALPAEDLMQAFIYQHLVPCKEQVVMVTKPAAPFTISPRLPARGYLELPLGKEVVFPVTVTRGKGFDGPIRIQLVDAPKGVVLRRGWIPAGKSSGQVAVQAEEKVEAKLKENMILSGTMSLEKPGSNPPAPGSSAPAAKPAEKKAPDKPAAPPAPAPKPDPAPANSPSSAGGSTGVPPVIAKPGEKKMEDPPMSEFRIAAKPPDAPPAAPPPTPASSAASKPPPPTPKNANMPVVERFTVTLPAIPFRMVDNPDLKSAKTDPAPNSPK